MSDIEFISYLPTDSDPYMMGIATIKSGTDIFRYKIVQKKDGTGWFPSAPSFRLAKPDGTYEYLPGFESDSKLKHDEIMNVIREEVSIALSNGQEQQQQQTQEFQPDECPF